jgi:hypothetical protein
MKGLLLACKAFLSIAIVNSLLLFTSFGSEWGRFLSGIPVRVVRRVQLRVQLSGT